MNKKIKSFGVVAILVVTALVFIPMGSGDTMETPFGQFRVEVLNIDSETGSETRMVPSSVLGSMLEFIYEGTVVGEIEVRIYVTATGYGFWGCEFDFSTPSTRPEISTVLSEGGNTIAVDSQMYSGPDYWTCPLDSEQLFWAYTCNLGDFASSFSTSVDHAFTIGIDFDFQDCTYRGKGGGDIIMLPVEGTAANTWEQTWSDPVYIDTFTYTTTAMSDVHHCYKHVNGNWVEFDTNFWDPPGTKTNTINMDTYGIRLAGWVHSGNTCTYTWTQYTDATGIVCTTVPLGTGGGDSDGPWNTFDASFTVETGVALVWSTETFCGDGSCKNEPYPGENCKSCPSDCGVCDAKMALVSVSLGSWLSGDDRGVGFAHGYDNYDWSSWGFPSTPYGIEIYENADSWAYYVYTGSGTTGKTLQAEAYVMCDGAKIYLYQEGWSNSGTTVSAGNWYIVGFWTEWDALHKLVKNVQGYKLYIDVWLEGGPNAHTLTVNPEEYHSEHTLVTNLASGASDSSHPYTFSVNGGEYYDIKVDWYNTMKEGEGKVTASNSGTMGSSDKTISVTHPDIWYILAAVDKITYGPFYMTMTPPSPPVQFDSFIGNWMFYRGSGTYEVTWESQSGYGTKTKSGTVTNAPIAIYLQWHFSGQIVSNNMFTITNPCIDSNKYSYGDKYLGVI